MAVETRRWGSAEPLLTLGLGRGPRTGLWKGLQIPRYPAHFFMGSVLWGTVEQSRRGDTAGSGTCHLWPCLSFVPASSPSVLACKMKIRRCSAHRAAWLAELGRHLAYSKRSINASCSRWRPGQKAAGVYGTTPGCELSTVECEAGFKVPVESSPARVALGRGPSEPFGWGLPWGAPGRSKENRVRVRGRVPVACSGSPSQPQGLVETDVLRGLLPASSGLGRWTGQLEFRPGSQRRGSAWDEDRDQARGGPWALPWLRTCAGQAGPPP